jgi:endonuclease III
MPLDTHILRISRYLGLTRRKSPGWTTAKAVTEALKRIEPEDPLKYDFPICHHGISGSCPVAKVPERCRVCSLLGECSKGRALTRARRMVS